MRAALGIYLQGVEKHIVSKGKQENKIEYYNIPAAFDIETSSFYVDKKKQGCMYIWQLGICGVNFTGRTWEDLKETLRAAKDSLDISVYKRLVIYIHNESYEFQWMRHYFEWQHVFAIDERTVAYGVTKDGFEFRCSYILTGKSLEMVGEDLQEIKCDKLHTLAYKQIRLSSSYISRSELQYCINDIKIVQNLIFEKILQDGSITKIPLTKTGYVRKYLRKCCLYGDEKTHKKQKSGQFRKYRRLMKALTIDGYREYRLLKGAFMGGYTHSNPRKTRKTLRAGDEKNNIINIGSFDFTSDYPFQLIAHCRYPMSKGEFVRPRNNKEFEHNLKYYCCIFEIELHNVQATFFNDYYIPFSKCSAIKGYHLSNGRVVSADTLTLCITEIDYEIICKTYKFDKSKSRLGYFIRYRRGYLPTPIVKAVLELYKDKTELKGNTKNC